MAEYISSGSEAEDPEVLIQNTESGMSHSTPKTDIRRSEFYFTREAGSIQKRIIDSDCIDWDIKKLKDQLEEL